MRLSFRFLLLLIPVLGGVVVAFNVLMDRLERNWALKDLSNQANLIFDTIHDPVYDSIATGRLNALHRIYKRIGNDPNLLGVSVCTLKGKTISKSGRFPRELQCRWEPKEEPTVEEAELQSKLLDLKSGATVHQAIFLLMDEEDQKPRGYVSVVQDPKYRHERSELARRYTIYAFLGLGLLISLITLLVYRWSVSRPIEQLSEVMKGVLTGDAEKISKVLENGEFAPLVQDIDEMLLGFKEAKGKKANDGKPKSNVWDSNRLSGEVRELFGESRLYVVSNEEPYIHNRRGMKVETQVPASGQITALEPVVRACSGMWIGRGSGSADHETADKNGMLLVPPEKPEYALKRVWLSRDEEQGFLYGFSNEGLWPLCHIAHERPAFRLDDWEKYVEVNAKFANTLVEETKATRPVVLVQDYHFALLPAMVRKMRPDSRVSLFWHIPWPGPESIRICPWRKDLLMGMLGADLIGFQLQYHANNFLDTCDRLLEARVSRDNFSVTIQGHTCFVKPFPVSVEWPNRFPVKGDDFTEIRSKFFEEFGISQGSILGVGVDRLDYTKGIVERLRTVERFLEKHPDMVGKFVFVQVAAPTGRMHIKRYQQLNSEIQQVADKINWKYHSDTYQPIILRLSHHSREEVFRCFRAADFCYVNPIHDGMNLVAKEFVSARSDEKGVLVLSNFSGASRELKDAVVVNPYDVEDSVDCIYRAVTMSPHEVKDRMRRLRNVVENNNVYTWGWRYLRELHAAGERANPGESGQS